MKILVTCQFNWADEMDFNGWEVMDSNAWDGIVERIKAHTSWPETKYLGTNEEMEIDSAKELLSFFEVKTITFDEAETLQRLFKGSSGRFLDVWENWDDGEEDEDGDA